ncbi:MAG: hypothetical protein M1277_00240 [Patescibacteria group bacterium]|nr:hypothetical protein [Patescibacteria group bacterium]
MNIKEIRCGSEQNKTRELNRKIARYFRTVGQRWPINLTTPGFGLRRKIDGDRFIEDIFVFAVEPKNNEYGIDLWPVKGSNSPENVFGWKENNGEQVILGSRSIIRLRFSLDGLRFRYSDGFDYVFGTSYFDLEELKKIKTKLADENYRTRITNFPMPDSANRSQWIRDKAPEMQQWLQKYRGNESGMYEIFFYALNLLNKQYSIEFPNFFTFQEKQRRKQ